MFLLPHSSQAFQEMSEYPHEAGALITHPGQARGIYLAIHPDAVDDIAAKLEVWFSGRPEVSIVDVGTSDKQGLGFILMEWRECEIDQLFLAILNNEEAIGDYTLFARTLEG